MNQKNLHDEIARNLADDGRLIEAGWMVFRGMVIPADASAIQVNEMKKAFFAGAQHLWGSAFGLLEAGEDATEKDMARMNQINDELKRWLEGIKRAL